MRYFPRKSWEFVFLSAYLSINVNLDLRYMPKNHFCWQRFGLKMPAVTNFIVANRPVLTGTVPIFGLLSRSCPGRAVQTGGVAHEMRSNCQRSYCQRARRQLVCKCPEELQSNSWTTNFMIILIHIRYLFYSCSLLHSSLFCLIIID